MKIPPFSLGSRKLMLKKPFLKGTDVRKLQQYLKWLGLFEDRIDGVFGLETHKSVKKLQEKSGVGITGIVDKNTTALLNRLLHDGSVDWPAVKRDAGYTGYSPLPLNLPLTKLWQRKLDVNGKILVKNHYVIVKTYRRLWCLNINTGRILWKREIEEDELWPVCEENLVIVAIDRRLTALNPGNGEIRWEFEAPDKIQSGPMIHKGRVFFTCCDRRIFALKTRDGELLWTAKIKTSIQIPAVVTPNHVIFPAVNKNVYAFDPTQGELKWKKKITEFPTACTTKRGKVYCLTENSKIYVFHEEGYPVWREKIGYNRYNTLLMPPRLIILCGENNITAADERARIKWEVSLPYPTAAIPVITDNYLWVGTIKGLFVYDVYNGTSICSLLENQRIYSLAAAKFYLFVAAEENICCFTSK